MTVIDESQTAKGFTPAALVPQVFGQARTLEGIVIHHWGLTGQTHDGVVDFFVNGPGATSAHFVASAGRINCLVSPPDAAWHCPGKNANTIGIECRPEATDADYATVAELVRHLRDMYGPLPLSMHRDWYSTACPGVWDLARIDSLASNGMAAAGSITPQGTITPAPAVQEDDMAVVPQDDWNAAMAILRSLDANVATKAHVQPIIDSVVPPAGGITPAIASAWSDYNRDLILTAVKAHPAGTPGTVDVDALVARLKAELPAAVLAELTAKLTKP